MMVDKVVEALVVMGGEIKGGIVLVNEVDSGREGLFRERRRNV